MKNFIKCLLTVGILIFSEATLMAQSGEKTSQQGMMKD